MCGKVTQSFSAGELAALYGDLAAAELVVATMPMHTAQVIALDAEGRRRLVPMRWGFPRSLRGRDLHVHARTETIDMLPTFADAFSQRRGVLQCATFNEGKELPNGRTQQWVVRRTDGAPIHIAVIFEEFDLDDHIVPCFVQATTAANPLISRITDRMPAVIQPADFALWLGEERAALADAKALLRVYDDDGAWEMAPQGAKGGDPKQISLF